MAALRSNTSRRHRQARYENHIRQARELDQVARQYLIEVLDATGAAADRHGPFPETTRLSDLQNNHPEMAGRKLRALEVSHA
ncbi:hypothetical protein [Pseudomonas sp. LRF_L74]|uniref:hypothetical protein n=1 Tax=Pseudomonas sp. LRF_L74 TaxID=3369422 RepID=UPI003F5E366C